MSALGNILKFSNYIFSLKYFIGHRGTSVPNADFMRIVRDAKLSKPTKSSIPSKSTETIPTAPLRSPSASKPSTVSNPSDPPADYKSYLVRYIHS